MRTNGLLLRRTRIEQGRGLSELARELGIGKSQLSKIERGIEGASPNTLKLLADALSLPMDQVAPELAAMKASQ